MDEATKARTHPGHWVLWMSAWSLQGVAIFVVDMFALEPPTIRFVVTGLAAAVPLVGLYLLLLARRNRSR